jgi:AraC-like DNA-binding protein
MSPGPVQEFQTGDLEEAHDFLSRAYAETHLSVGGAPETVFLRHRRRDGGEFYHDLFDDTLDVSFTTNPLGHLLVGEITRGRCERDSGGVSERFGRGDVLLLAEPHLPHVCHIPTARISLIGISLQAVASVTGDASLAAPRQLRLAVHRPLSSRAAERWKRTSRLVAGLLPDTGDGELSPLMAANAAELAAAAFLDTFPSTAMTADYVRGPGWVAPASVRRAAGFIDAYADRPVTAGQLAAVAGVTGRALQQAFRRHYGTTTAGYLRQVRLERAHSQLRNAGPADGTTVTAVARQWGWASPARFTADYRRRFGVSPGRTLHDNRPAPGPGTDHSP